MQATEVIAVLGARASRRDTIATDVAEDTDSVLVSVGGRSEGGDHTSEVVDILTRTAPARAVVVFPGDTSATDVIGALTDDDALRLTEVICVIDAPRFFEDLSAEDYVRLGDSPTPFFVAAALRTVQQIEHASLLVLTDWRSVSTRDLSVVMSALSHLAPRARLQLHRGAPVPQTAAFDERTHQPGWAQILSEDFSPHMTDPRVSAFRYEHIHPFHPDRVRVLLEDGFGTDAFGTVLRSAGFCRFATRSGVIGSWDHVGQMIAFDPLALDEQTPPGDVLALGQDIAFLGLDLDHAHLTAALDAAVLTAAEMMAGPREWATYPDPFPAWHVGTHPGH